MTLAAQKRKLGSHYQTRRVIYTVSLSYLTVTASGLYKHSDFAEISRSLLGISLHKLFALIVPLCQ